MTFVSSNRNRYTSAPLYGLKNKPLQKSAPQQPRQPQPQAQNAPQTQQQQYGQAPLQQYPQQQQYGQPFANPAPQQPYQQPYGQPYQTPPYQNPYQQQFANPAPQQPYQQHFTSQAQSQQQVQQPARRKSYNWLIAVVTLALPVLFLLALLMGNVVLHGVFIACALAVIGILLFARPFSKNARYTLALIYGALLVVIAVALLFSLPARDSLAASGNVDASALFGGDSALNSVSAQNPQTDDTPQDPVPEVSATDSPDASMASMRLNTFMNYWAESQLDSMLELCLPSWVNNLENPKSELFILLANRTPMSYTVEKISGSEADTSRTVTLTVLIDKKNTSEPAYYQMQVLMLRINDTWYVDPNSLGATKMQTTPQPGDQEAGTIPFVPTQAPTEAPTMSANMLLYYNPDGGLYYHAKEDCYSVAEEYLPLKAFYFSDINNTTFKNLLACHKCDAPARPVITGN